MRVLIFGASGMVGGGVLRECLADPAVEQVISVARTAGGSRHAKLTEVVHAHFQDFATIEASAFAGIDAAFFCLGVASSGMPEADYTRVTYEYTVAAARTLARVSPAATFVYVSGVGADSTEAQPDPVAAGSWSHRECRARPIAESLRIPARARAAAGRRGFAYAKLSDLLPDRGSDPAVAADTVPGIRDRYRTRRAGHAACGTDGCAASLALQRRHQRVGKAWSLTCR